MLRIHFTSDDIARVRLADGADPLWELVLSVHMFRGQRGDLLFAEWRRAALWSLRRSPFRREIKLMAGLIPQIGYFPDFLTPDYTGGDLDAGLDVIRSTPRKRVRAEVQLLSAPYRSSVLAGLLPHAGSSALTTLTVGMQAWYAATIQPHERTIQAAVQRDRMRRIAAFARGGVAGLLESFGPTMQWTGGELQVPFYLDQELTLGSRGLLLIPSYFCVNQPVTLLDDTLAPVLVYPIDRGEQVVIGGGLDHALSLGRLIGRTRALVLDAVGGGISTLELATRVGIAPASASEHVTVLRDAGLVVSHREGNRVIHELTSLGASLLRADQVAAPTRRS